jgi:DNA repair protein RecO (recombination protein O)
MLHKTRGVVLGFIKYGDTSIISKIYTEEFGLQTYIVNGVRSKTSKNKIALFQSLTLLDMVVYHKENRDINRISEIKCNTVFHSIPFEQKKISMVIFIAELLSKTLKEHYQNKELFELILHSISYLDEIKERYENLHLQFMIQLASFLGFSPGSVEDIIEEIRLSLSEEEKNILSHLMVAAPDEYVKMSNHTRRHLLDCLVRYYSIHIENFGTLNSLSVLQEIFG